MTESLGLSPDHSADLGDGLVLNADLALLLSLEAWGFPGVTGTEGALASGPWRRLEPGWQERLRLLEENNHAVTTPYAAREQLLLSHRLQSRADLTRVHPSWWIRALKDESPAVRAAVGSLGLPERGTSSRSPRDPAADSDGENPFPNPEVFRWVLALWTERLVGGEPVQVNEPWVIVAIAGLSPVSLYRLCKACGLGKMVLAADPGGSASLSQLDRDRREWFHDRFTELFGPDEIRPRDWARREVERNAEPHQVRPRRRLATLGLITLGRLLAPCEPFRVRWTLQHLPYLIAKRVRAIMSHKSTANETLVGLESLILKAAWQRLTLEGRLELRESAATTRPSHVR